MHDLLGRRRVPAAYLVRVCCRDAAGCAHVACKAKYATHQGPGHHTGWYKCPTCKQEHTGPMQLGLAEALCTRLQGRPAEDNDRLLSQNGLAVAYDQAGRFAEAEPLYRDLFATRHRVDGPNHVNTLQVAGNLGGILLNQRKLNLAEAVYRDTLERQRQALGTEHQDTLGTAHNLALVLQLHSKFAEAEPLVRDTLAIQQRVLGEGHVITLITACNLMMLLVKTDKYAEAAKLGRATMAQSTRTLGPDHPRSLGIASTLATALGNQDQTAEAVDLLTATLATQQRVLGPGNPQTQQTAQRLQRFQLHVTGRELSCKATNLRGLATCGHCGAEKMLDALKKCGKCRAVHYCDGACQRAHWKRGGHKELCREQFACTICLDDDAYPLPIQCGCGCRDASGCAHVACTAEYAAHQGPGYHTGWYKCPTCKQEYSGPMQLGLAEALCKRLQGRSLEDDDRLNALIHLAIACSHAGRFAEAEALYRHILAVRQHLFGPNHKGTLFVAGNLGNTLTNQRKNSEAEALLRDTLARQVAVLGTEDENTLCTAGTLARVLLNQGKEAEAEPVLRATLTIQQHVLGKGHVDTLDTVRKLTFLLGNTGKYAEAVGLGRGGLVRATRTLGPDHPLSLMIACALAFALGEQGQTPEAVALLTATRATQHRVLGPGHPETQQTVDLLQRYQQGC